MKCRGFKTEDGISVIACGSRLEVERCVCCGKSSGFQCDYPDPGRKSGTCDKLVCGECAKEVGFNLHHCPDHA